MKTKTTPPREEHYINENTRIVFQPAIPWLHQTTGHGWRETAALVHGTRCWCASSNAPATNLQDAIRTIEPDIQ